MNNNHIDQGACDTVRMFKGRYRRSLKNGIGCEPMSARD